MASIAEKKEQYADLAVRVGVNIQKGQKLVINAPVTSADFVRTVTKKAYQHGASNVHVEWNDDETTRIRYDMAPLESFHDFPAWKARGFEEMAEEGAAFMTIKSTDPDLLKGVDGEKIAAANKASGEAMNTFRSYIQSDKVSWLVISAPSYAWAKKVFPEASADEAVNQLWEAIFEAVRINKADPVAEWKQHDENLQEKARFLTDKKYTELRYQAPGTDLTIGLPDGHVWIGGGGPNKDGVHFVANMPTEEVFTAPKADAVNGTVRNTKPLNYGGNVIDGFSLTFKDGKVSDFSAEEGEETLKNLLETDEGASRLGEVALVPHSSPISQSGILFYNTLYDENASNHIALGSAYATCVAGGAEMSKEQLGEAGLNTSITHVDFMIGSAEMDIDGVLPDGSVEPVFRNGEWVI
ncbi:aminopeptidase [Salisediminibacterium halotolerans]|uniref:aminopeptidase n=1 Tax=Salisediminibacterium halotolerans TaxID=517425 RepID=UPI000EAE7043|nr:aminopeptidase [Salisediminibacterium halotolerans]RLJ69667.1 aminopeptidase II [Actinophytocola xinjiangensis]RPE89725.1 aminopeptidase II [Salisediminibacterium halotolerans]TWG32561.1 aminopeptidase II [Salisediminibacterium halotolerans]GEL08452.1 aminopeptidase AmpS [Salisediminibacterium halotolerans]